jgi:hypothetical protein
MTAGPVLAGGCGSPCLGVGVADVLNSSLPSSVDSVSGSQVLAGHRSWNMSLQSTPGSGTATNASISVQSGYPPALFNGVSAFPVTTSTAAIGPNQELDLSLNGGITASFATGFDSARTMSPALIPSAGGQQTVRITATRTDPSACITNIAGQEGCTLSGNIATGMPGAAIVSVSPPANLNQSEQFSSNTNPLGVDLHLNDPILGKAYSVTVVISLPSRGHPYFYKPTVGLSLGSPGPHGCQQDVCSGPSTSATIADPTLDGAVPGAGQVTVSADQAFIWDQGGPYPSKGLGYLGQRGDVLPLANLAGANLRGADLSGAILVLANLRNANLQGANLAGAFLIGANLSGANLSGADLSGANLSYANLSGANLTGANLTGANLTGANLRGVIR